ncbi:hypothetical protein [Mycoplasma buteonis]|uniref:hypothetical protein n=1 Tax=Mycoplasma buteonis TaxID=171280 RepID=UPI0005687208|nr:hypothetical protein [Mycoplasma buteonis]
MTTLEIKEIFYKTLISTIGIKKIHPMSYDENFTLDQDVNLDDANVLDFLQANETEKGWTLQVAVTILDGVQTKFIASQLHNNITKKFKQKKIPFYKLIIIFKGVINE